MRDDRGDILVTGAESLVTNRFEIDKSAPPKAWDRVFLRTVAVKRLPKGLSAQGSGAQLLEAWERWQEAPHAGLLKPIQLDFQKRRLVREWVSGFSLMELLRHRHRLKSVEAMALLESATGVLDHAGAHGLLTEAALDKWFIAFDEGGDDALSCVAEPFDQWPPWRMRLDPLRLATLLPIGDERTKQIPNTDTGGVSPPVWASYCLVRELLGGSITGRAGPLAALTDEGNHILLAALKPGQFTTAEDFAKALVASQPERRQAAPPLAPPIRHYNLIVSPEAGSSGGEKLLLESAKAGTRPLQLVHRSEFRLGRSSADADMTPRFTDRSPQTEELVKGISRVHVRLQRIGNEVIIFDGSASAPSNNGTFTKEGPLLNPAGLPLRQNTTLQLGTCWRAVLAPITAPPESALLRVQATTVPSINEPAEAARCNWGAVFVLPLRGCSARMESVWLIEEAGFGLGVDGALEWDIHGPGAAPAAFHVLDGGFFLLNRRINGEELSVDLHQLEPGSACPLRSGMLLSAGRDMWRIRIA